MLCLVFSRSLHRDIFLPRSLYLTNLSLFEIKCFPENCFQFQAKGNHPVCVLSHGYIWGCGLLFFCRRELHCLTRLRELRKNQCPVWNRDRAAAAYNIRQFPHFLPNPVYFRLKYPQRDYWCCRETTFLLLCLPYPWYNSAPALVFRFAKVLSVQ